MGWAFALDTLWDYLKPVGLGPKDLNWQGFNPERDLIRIRDRRTAR